MSYKKYTLRIWNKINSFIKENKLIKKGEKLLLAVSGGPDSMLMLHYFDKTKKYNFIVFHLNHGIRKEAKYDEKLVRDWCKKNSIEFISEKFSIPSILRKNKDNLENAARKIRYKLFLKYARKYKCSLIATAHNLDEHIETVILNLIRGKSIKGLCGIPVKRKISNSIYVIRPIMCLKKEEILRYLKENKIRYALDKTNYDTSYTRNWIRHKLIPMIEKKQPNFGNNLIEISRQISKIYKSKY
jgi:tRNA(Ile)-lysidine synthase